MTADTELTVVLQISLDQAESGVDPAATDAILIRPAVVLDRASGTAVVHVRIGR